MDTSDKNGVSYIKYHYKLTTAIIVEKSLAAVPNDCLSGLVSLVFAVSIEPYWQYETSARATVTVYIHRKNGSMYSIPRVYMLPVTPRYEIKIS